MHHNFERKKFLMSQKLEALAWYHDRTSGILIAIIYALVIVMTLGGGGGGGTRDRPGKFAILKK